MNVQREKKGRIIIVSRLTQMREIFMNIPHGRNPSLQAFMFLILQSTEIFWPLGARARSLDGRKFLFDDSIS